MGRIDSRGLQWAHLQPSSHSGGVEVTAPRQGAQGDRFQVLVTFAALFPEPST